MIFVVLLNKRNLNFIIYYLDDIFLCDYLSMFLFFALSALMEKSKAMAPMTKEEWEKRQSIVRRVLDEDTGRYRLSYCFYFLVAACGFAWYGNIPKFARILIQTW